MRKLIVWGVAAASFVGFLGYRAVADDAPKAAETKVIADFETDADAKLAKGGDDYVKVEVDESHATSGKKSLKISCPKGNDYCPVDIIGDALKGWDKDKYKNLAIDFTTDQDVTLPVSVEVLDANSTNFKTRASVEDLTPLKKGKVTVIVPLSSFQRNDKSGAMDLTKITKCRVIIFTKDLKEDLVTYMDNVRLTNEDAK